MTVRQWHHYLAVCKHQASQPSAEDTHPATGMNWEEACEYADWAKASLPTEAQWEKAARGTDGRRYPWGNEWDAHNCHCSKQEWGDAGGTAPVGSYPADVSPYGAVDMAGNISQWCADWYQADYYHDSPLDNPTGPETGTLHVLRGEYWKSNGSIYFRCTYRDHLSPQDRSELSGFRCVVTPGE